MKKSVSIVLALLQATVVVNGFVVRPSLCNRILFSSKEEEIAKLESQLQKLREETSEQGLQPAEETPSESKLAAEAVEEEVTLEYFLSEQWKEKEMGGDGAPKSEGLALPAILGAIGIAVLLAVFSQVPIGQEDLSKYSAIKAPSEQIDLGDLNRSRKAGDL